MARRSTTTISIESALNRVVAPESTCAWIVSHFRVGTAYEPLEKSACRTARHRRAVPVRQLGAVMTRESSRVAPSSSVT